MSHSIEWQGWFSAVCRFATAYFQPPVDPSQDITDTVASFQNGFTTINFTRPRNSSDMNDISLDQCRFLLYAYGSSVTVATRMITYHQNNRGILTQMFCLPSANDCPAPTTPTPGTRTLHFLGQVWASPTLVCSMLCFVCTVHIYIGPYVTAGAAIAARSACRSYCTPLLPPRAPIVLPHSVSFIEQVCPTVRLRLSDANRGRR